MKSSAVSRVYALYASLFSLCFSPLAQARSLNRPTLLSPSAISSRSPNTIDDEELFFKFVTRPDIGAPKWEVTYYDKDALAPGYWFLSPYAQLGQVDFPLWNGPHIYDNNGDLIWSGAPAFQHLNVHDFRVQMYDGEPRLTLILADGEPASWGNASHVEGHGHGIIMDSSYNIIKTVDMTGDRPHTNMHDFSLLDGGKTAVMITMQIYDPTHLEVPKYNGSCRIGWQGFREVDVETGKSIFDWGSRAHVGVLESTHRESAWPTQCKEDYDITHFNAIDKFDDGDYLLSGRHTNTLYKINHTDGSVVWRCGGNRSDFVFADQDAYFTRQHHARLHEQNATHVNISIFDNAKGHGPSQGEIPSSESSWGMYLSLRTDVTPMTVSLISRYQHPEGDHAPSRGSMSFLENGNAFVGWVFHSLQSEHSFDGKLLMKARYLHKKANTYRSYKFPWIGKPSSPPDVVSVAKGSTENMKTQVHVSWNGATEVATWNLLQTQPDGSMGKVIASSPRTGFETALSADGFSRYVVVAAYCSEGNELGRSEVTETAPPPAFNKLSIADAADWLNNHTMASDAHSSGASWWNYHPIAVFLLGFLAATVVGGVTVVLLRRARASKRRQGGAWWFSPMPAYQSVAGSEEDLARDHQDFSLDDDETEQAEKPSIIVTSDG